MDISKIAKDNHAFFINVISLALCTLETTIYTLASLGRGSVCYPLYTECGCGNLSIDSTNVIDNCSVENLAKEIRQGILVTVAGNLKDAIRGDLNDVAEIIIGAYKFIFKVVQYERGGEYAFELVDDPQTLPDGETVGRMVALDITVAET